MARFVADHVPPVAISFLRWVLAFFILIPFAWPHLKRDWPVLRSAVAIMALLAFSGTAAPNTIAFYALQFTQALNALLIQSISPLLIGLWTLLLFRERMTLAQTTGILISLTGVVIIICRGNPETLLSMTFNIGDLLVVLSLLIFSFYSALAKRRPLVHPLSFLVFNIGLGTIMLAPFYALEIASGHVLILDTTTILVLIYVSIFPSFLAYLFFNRGVELVGPNRAAPFLHLMPVFGSLLAITLLGEKLQLFHLAGYALVIVGITVATRARI